MLSSPCMPGLCHGNRCLFPGLLSNVASSRWLWSTSTPAMHTKIHVAQVTMLWSLESYDVKEPAGKYNEKASAEACHEQGSTISSWWHVEGGQSVGTVKFGWSRWRWRDERLWCFEYYHHLISVRHFAFYVEKCFEVDICRSLHMCSQS